MVIWVIESVDPAIGHLSVTFHDHAIILILVSLSMTQNLEAKKQVCCPASHSFPSWRNISLRSSLRQIQMDKRI